MMSGVVAVVALLGLGRGGVRRGGEGCCPGGRCDSAAVLASPLAAMRTAAIAETAVPVSAVVEEPFRVWQVWDGEEFRPTLDEWRYDRLTAEGDGGRLWLVNRGGRSSSVALDAVGVSDQDHLRGCGRIGSRRARRGRRARGEKGDAGPVGPAGVRGEKGDRGSAGAGVDVAALPGITFVVKNRDGSEKRVVAHLGDVVTLIDSRLGVVPK